MQILITILTLAVLETLLSVDNAVVLALIARELKPAEQKKALSYGLIGALVLRFAAILLVSQLLQYSWIKVVGGTYLLWLAIQFFFFKKEKSHPKKVHAQFWKAVIAIELTDLIFAIDSILAAVAISSNVWVIMAGGMLGVIAIRFAATHMIKILKRYPLLEPIAYGMIAIVAIKVIYEGSHSFW